MPLRGMRFRLSRWNARMNSLPTCKRSATVKPRTCMKGHPRKGDYEHRRQAIIYEVKTEESRTEFVTKFNILSRNNL